MSHLSSLSYHGELNLTMLCSSHGITLLTQTRIKCFMQILTHLLGLENCVCFTVEEEKNKLLSELLFSTVFMKVKGILYLKH